MKNSLNIRQSIGFQLVRAGQAIMGQPTRRPYRGVGSDIRFRNPFSGMLIRRMGVKMEPRVIQVVHGWNDVTVVGKNHLLDVVFGNTAPVTQVDPWYIGCVNNSPSPTFSENDTLASHAGWSEWSTYTGNRQEWDDANAAAKIKGTTTVSTFPMTGAGTINGIFIASVDSGTAGLLWATGSFDELVDVIGGDDLKVTYGIRT
jgi:hypothetical protein